MITEGDSVREPIGDGAGGSSGTVRSPPAVQQLRELANSANYAEAAALLDGVDLGADFSADFQYYAGVCLGSVGRQAAAIDLLKRAAAGGYATFWCAFHLGLFEMRRGNDTNAACYYSLSLLSKPERTDVYPLLERVAPEIELASLHAAQSGARSMAASRVALDLGAAKQELDQLGAAVHYFATALALDPENAQARARLLELTPDIALAVLPAPDNDRPNAEVSAPRSALAESVNASTPTPRTPPTAQRLQELADSANYAEAAALLDGVDLGADFGVDFQYYAGVCLGSVGREEAAIKLLKRAVAGGYARFWCAFHLGQFEMRRGTDAAAAGYFTVCLILDPARTDIYPLLERVAPGIDLAPLHAAQAGTHSVVAAQDAFALGNASLAAGVSDKPAAAAVYFTIAAALDPYDGEARSRLREIAPNISLAVLPQGTVAPVKRGVPALRDLEQLVDSGHYQEAAALLEGVDLDGDLGANVHYYAGVTLGAVGEVERAIGLLKRASAGGFATFWCAYHLGLFEMKRGKDANAAAYFSACLVLNPARSDIYPLLAQVAPDIDLAPLRDAQATRPARQALQISLAIRRGIDDANEAEHSIASSGGGLTAMRGSPPPAWRLQQLANSGRYGDAVALLEGVDLAADLPPDFLYLAGVCLGSVNQEERRAINLLKRAVEGGYSRFWCAYHLGLFEEKLGNPAKATYYYTAALILDPARTDIWPLLARVTPDTDFTRLREAQAGKPSGGEVQGVFSHGMERLQAGSVGSAVCCFTTALALDPLYEEARSQLLELAPDLSVEVVTGIDFDRLFAELGDRLEEPASGDDDLERKLELAAKVHSIIQLAWHERGHALIPALEGVLRRALATPGIALDRLCMLYDVLAFLYFYMAPHSSAMRGFAEHVVKPFAAAIRDGVGCAGLAPIVRRPLGRGRLRLGYLSEFANQRPGNAVGPFIGHVMGGLSRNFPENYRLFLYAWSNYDDAFLAELGSSGISHRQFDDSSIVECMAAVAHAIAEDEIDILITDMHSPFSTVLFERRVAPVQIFYCMGGLPFWPLQNLDAVFRIDVYDPKLDGWDLAKCYPFGLGPWDVARLAPTINPERIVAERARFPAGKRLIGNYGRLAKMTPDFLSIAAELVARHSDVVVVLGGTGNGRWIREFIASQGLTGRIELVEGFVDGHIWAHLLEVFLDTFPTEGGLSRREVMAAGKPVVTMLGTWAQFEAVPMLVARERNGYLEIVSRLLAEPDFYDAAVAGTRQLIAFGITDFDYASAVRDALTAIVDRSERSVNLRDYQE